MKEVENVDTINESAEKFVSDVKKLLPSYIECNVFNTDQLGLELEMHSNRTLSFEEEKITVATVRSKHNITHSYTVQPILSMESTPVGLLFLCLKEAVSNC